jgi:lipoate-protein ligase A
MEQRSASPQYKDSWYFLWSGLNEAAWNMAADDWLLATARSRPPVVRFYGWLHPTVSLGRHEPWREVVDLDRLAAGGVSLVRRPTGGRAVLHHREITYSVTAGRDGREVWRDRLEATMARISGALARGFERLGVSADYTSRGGRVARPQGHRLCFESATRYELSSEGVKAVGSAQLRTEAGFLQHGSIPLAPTLPLLWSLGPGAKPCPPDPGLPAGLAGLASRPLEELSAALAQGFEDEFGVSGNWLGREFVDEAAVEELVASRYGSAGWTFRR